MRPIIIVLITLLLALQYKLWIANGGILTAIHLTHVISQQKTENDALQQRNSILTATIESFKTDPNTTEATARNELNMIKHGETYYQIIVPTPRNTN
jgi:cell division protein FtsB